METQARRRQTPLGSRLSPAGRRRGAVFLHFLALVNLVLAQPLFDLLGRQAEFFVAHAARPSDLILLVVVLSLALPLVLAVVVWALGLVSPGLEKGAHFVGVAVLAVLLALLALKRLPVPLPVHLLLALVLGLGTALSLRFQAVRSFALVVAGVSLVIPFKFLFLTPVRGLVWVSEPDPEAAFVPEVPRPSPVVVVVFDELPLSSLLDRDHDIDASRFPNFAALAADSIWFRRATTVSESTQYAVPALLTGRYPDRVRLPTVQDYPENLFTLLGGHYTLRAVESLTRLCPDSLCRGGPAAGGHAPRLSSLLEDMVIVYLHLLLPQRLAAGLPSIATTWQGFGDTVAPQARQLAGADADRQTDVHGAVTTFLDGLAWAPGDGVLHYLHLDLPHIPWRFLPSGREYGPISRSFFAHGVAGDTTWTGDPWLVAQGLQRHLIQLAFTDHLLGRILEQLKEAGLYRRALLVVTADHGLSFLSGEPGRIPSQENFQEVMSVPLFMRLPGEAKAAVSDMEVELIDVLPTVAHALGLSSLPWAIHGQSMLDPGFEERREKRLWTGGELRMVVPAADFGSKEKRAVERLNGIFGSRTGVPGLFAIVPRSPLRGLLGLKISELDVGSDIAADVTLDQPWFFDRVDPAGRFVPAQIEGRILPAPGEVPETVEVAVAVNGVVQAITRTYRLGEALRFSAMVPEEAFVPGRNVPQIFLLPKETANRRPAAFLPTRVRSGPRYSMVRTQGGHVTRLEASNRTSCQVVQDRVKGGLVGRGTYYEGWASDPEGQAPFVVIMVFLDGELVYVTTTGREPPLNSPVGVSPGYEESGFHFGLPLSLLKPGHDSEVLVFGVVGEVCSRLEAE